MYSRSSEIWSAIFHFQKKDSRPLHFLISTPAGLRLSWSSRSLLFVFHPLLWSSLLWQMLYLFSCVFWVRTEGSDMFTIPEINFPIRGCSLTSSRRFSDILSHNVMLWVKRKRWKRGKLQGKFELHVCISYDRPTRNWRSGLCFTSTQEKVRGQHLARVADTVFSTSTALDS